MHVSVSQLYIITLDGVLDAGMQSVMSLMHDYAGAKKYELASTLKFLWPLMYL